MSRLLTRSAAARRQRARAAVLMMLTIVAAIAMAVPAQAAQPKLQQFRTTGQLTGPTTAAGTWSSTGLVEAWGSYTETFRFAGKTIHSRKVLVSEGGTIVLDIRGVVDYPDACTAVFQAGSWHIVEATGTFSGLLGGGTPAATATSFGNVCTGAIDVTHVGAAHLHD